MNWNKVINVLVLLFAFINLVLFGYQQAYESKRYTLPLERERQIDKALTEAGIVIYEYVPTYYPQRQLELEAPVIDQERIQKEVLGDKITIKAGDVLGEIVSNGNESLTFYSGEQDGYIFYKKEGFSEVKNSLDYVPEDMTLDKVENVALKFVEDLYGGDVDMEITYLKSINEDLDAGVEKGYRIELNEKFKGKIIFQSYIKMHITESGIQEALAVRFKPVDFIGSTKNIYPFDEVIYSLMYYLEDELDSMTIEDTVNKKTIRDVAIGYYLLDVDRRKYSYNLDPHYRIIFDSGEIYYINAYTNDIIVPE